MGKALYRKYRSKSLSEVIGQSHITDTLDQAIKSGRISHAYLFTGPRGVGKTSIARILAHKINDLPYEGDEVNHLDIIEIDAASNRRIDEIRELKSRVHVAPAQAKYKVYIIDEVHMLTKEAFNALLKTLEEPPKHAVFILATTDAHKLPETIVSRTQRFGFKPISKPDLVNQLKDIAKKEEIDIDDKALELIAEHGDGSFRDSIGLLDQAQHRGGRIDADYIAKSLGLAPDELVNKIIKHLVVGNSKALHETFAQAKLQGVQPVQLAAQLAGSLRKQLLSDELGMDRSHAIDLLKQLALLPAHPKPQEGLELVLFDILFTNNKPTSDNQIKSNSNSLAEARVSKAPKETVQPVTKPSTKKKANSEANTKKNDKQPKLKKTSGRVSPDIWNEVLEALKSKYNTLYGTIRMANPIFDEDSITLECRFPFHQKRLKDSRNQKIVTDIVHSLTGLSITLNAVVNKDLSQQQAPPVIDAPKPLQVADNDDVQAISNIFDGAEVVE